MNDQNDKNLPADGGGILSQDAQPICPKCLEPYDPPKDYCANCDSNEPLSLLAAYVPFVRIRFKAGLFGKMWRKVLNSETSIAMRFFSLFLIVIYAPVMLTVGLPFLLISKIKEDGLRKTITIAFIVFLALAMAFYVVLI